MNNEIVVHENWEVIHFYKSIPTQERFALAQLLKDGKGVYLDTDDDLNVLEYYIDNTGILTVGDKEDYKQYKKDNEQ